MTTVLECTTEGQHSVMPFLVGKNINKEMFPVCGGKCSLHKAVHNWVEKRGRRSADDEEVEAEVVETTSVGATHIEPSAR
jgi:hypothetical protein